MFETLNTYRSFFYPFLLLSYLLSVFQTPIFELAHFLSHASQMISTHTELHSYEGHHTHDHAHNFLAFFDHSTSENKDHSTTNKELKLEKKAEINVPVLVTSEISLPDISNNFGTIKKPISLFQTLAVPPPQFF